MFGKSCSENLSKIHSESCQISEMDHSESCQISKMDIFSDLIPLNIKK